MRAAAPVGVPSVAPFELHVPSCAVTCDSGIGGGPCKCTLALGNMVSLSRCNGEGSTRTG